MDRTVSYYRGLVFMKHVFVIHSVLTRVVSEAVIQHRNLAKADCVQILLRNQAGIEGVFSVDETELDWISRWREISIRAFRKKALQFAGHTNLDTGFFAYLPNMKTSISSLLLGLSGYSGHYFIEEGSLSYFPVGMTGGEIGRSRGDTRRTSWLQKAVKKPPLIFLRHWRFWLRYKNVSYYDPAYLPVKKFKYLGAFATSPKCFAGADNRAIVKVDWQKYQQDLPEQGVQVLVVFDAAVEFGLIDETTYRERFYMAIKSLGASVTVHYKLHPAQEVDLFQHSDFAEFTAVKLPAHVCLEALVMRDRPKLIYWCSSVGEFAANKEVETTRLAPWPKV